MFNIKSPSYVLGYIVGYTLGYILGYILSYILGYILSYILLSPRWCSIANLYVEVALSKAFYKPVNFCYQQEVYKMNIFSIGLSSVMLSSKFSKT